MSQLFCSRLTQLGAQLEVVLDGKTEAIKDKTRQIRRIDRTRRSAQAAAQVRALAGVFLASMYLRVTDSWCCFSRGLPAF